MVAHATSKGGRDPVIALPGIFEPGTESAERVSCRTVTVVNSVTHNHGIQRALLVDLLPWAMDRGFQPKEFVAVLRDYPEVRRKVRSALLLKLRALGARASDPALVHGEPVAIVCGSSMDAADPAGAAQLWLRSERSTSAPFSTYTLAASQRP